MHPSSVEVFRTKKAAHHVVRTSQSTSVSLQQGSFTGGEQLEGTARKVLNETSSSRNWPPCKRVTTTSR